MILQYTCADIWTHWAAFGLARFLRAGEEIIETERTETHSAKLEGRISLYAIPYLKGLYPSLKFAPALLHPEVGDYRIEFRSKTGLVIPERSCQIVIGIDTGLVYSDLDRYSPLHSMEELIRHNVEEVHGPKIKRWLGKLVKR